MTKNTRLIFLLILLPLSFLIARITTGSFIPTGTEGQWFFSGILLLVLGSFFLEHHYVKPSDVIANSIQVLTVLLLVEKDIAELGWSHSIWFVLIGYTLLTLASASISMFLVDNDKSEQSKRNIVASILKVFALKLGRAEIIYSIIFLSSILFYFETDSAEFLILLAYWAMIILLRPLGITSLVEKVMNKGRVKNSNIGKVLYSEAENLISIELFADINVIAGQQIMTRRRDGKVYMGIVYSITLAHDKTVAKIFLDNNPNIELQSAQVRFNEFALLSDQEPVQISSVVGLVAEGTDIATLRFFVYPQCELKEGDVVKTMVYNTPVYYQIINAQDKEEQLSGQNTYGKTLAIAKQIGEWLDTEGCFENFGWVPLLNSPVFVVRQDEEVNYERKDGEYQVGTLPNTNFPVMANIDSLVTHHAAIIGITGSGKTRTARRMVEEIVKSGRKVICVDFTGEYMSLFDELGPKAIVTEQSSTKVNESLKSIHLELEKFENQQDKEKLKTGERAIHEAFKEEIDKFIADDAAKVGIFELPEILNTKAALDYTKYFFKVLFKLAKDGQIGGGLAVVLEEAHTIVPESNFLGTDDKMSKSVMNAIGQIALQGRKHGIGFIVITQRTANVSKTILTQCNSIICFRMYDNTGLDFLSNYVGKEMVQAIPNLSVKKGFREAVLIGKAFNSKHPVITRIPEDTLNTAHAAHHRGDLVENVEPFEGL